MGENDKVINYSKTDEYKRAIEFLENVGYCENTGRCIVGILYNKDIIVLLRLKRGLERKLKER